MFLPASQPGESVATGQYVRNEGDDSEEDIEDDRTEEEVDRQQATTSTTESNHYVVVKVTRTAHTFSKDEFIFKDRKGRSRTTTRDSWRRTTYNGQVAWKHHNYICFDDILRQ